MVLGIRSKSRKRVSIQVHYIIYVQEIKPWPPSESLRSAQSVLLQWENGDNSGSLPSTAGDGKIQFNESFRLSVLLWRDASKKGKHHESFHKNCLEFHLYDMTVKSQLLGSTTINFADFGIIKEAKAIRTQLSFKKSFRNSAQSFLYANIQPFDVECSSSSPHSSMSKELSVDREENESASHSVNDDDLEIDSFTDDDSDDIPSSTLQTMRSTSETARDDAQTSKGGTRGSNGEFVPPLENITSSLMGNTMGEASTQFNGIKSPFSSLALSSDMGNAANGRLSLPIISKESVKVADASSRSPKNIQQFSEQKTKGAISSASSSSVQPNFERSSQSQVTQEDSMNEEDSTRDQRYNTDSKIPESIQQFCEENTKGDMVKTTSSASSPRMQLKFERSSQSQVTQENSMNEEDSPRDQRYNTDSKIPESIRQFREQNTKGVMVKAISSASSPRMQLKFERSFQSQVTQEDSMNEEDSPRDQRYNTDSKIPESIRQFREQNTKDVMVKAISSASLPHMQPKFERSSKSQVTQEDIMNQEDSPRDRRYNKDSKIPVSIQQFYELNTKDVMVKAISSASSSSMQPNFERSSQSQATPVDSMNQEDSPRDQSYNKDSKIPESIQQSYEQDIKGVTVKAISSASLSSTQPIFERSSQSQVTQADSMSQEDSPRDQRYNKDSEIPRSTHQFCEQNTKGDMVKAISSATSSSVQPNLERSSQSQVTLDDSMNQEDSPRDQRYNRDSPEKVSSVSNSRVLEDRKKMDKRRKGKEQSTMRNEVLENELVSSFYDDDSTRKGKLNSAIPLLSKKSYEHPTSILMNDKAEHMKTVKFPIQSAESYGQFNRCQTLDQEEEINTSNDVHVGAASHEDINLNGSFANDKTELKTEVEMLREELREAAALEISLYSVIAEHGSSSNKVHAPARRLSRFYFHTCRVGSSATIASAAQSAVSGFVLVSKACGNDVPRLTFWFSNLILLRAIVSKGIEEIHLGDGPCINSECDGNDPPFHEEEKENTKKQFHGWEDPETFLVALQKVEAWIFTRIIESVWWQTLTPYMQSAAAKSSSSRKIHGKKRYGTGDQDQGSFSTDLWERAFKDACERLCPLRAGGHECGCLPVIARLVP